MKAVIIQEDGETGKAVVGDVKHPSPRPNYVKVKTVAVAINPTDGYHVESPGVIGRVGGILGCDLSGIIEDIGDECTTDLQKGDRVFGVSHGGNLSNDEDGAFAEYAMVKDGMIGKIPEGISFEEAATLGVGLSTAAQSLYMILGLTWPGENQQNETDSKNWVLIYGGSTASGTLAIQFAKLSGYPVVSTASPENFELVKSRGADVVFDYKDPECAAKIRKHTHDSIRYVVDTIGTEASYTICAASLPDHPPLLGSPEEIKLVSLLEFEFETRKDINNIEVLAYTSLGEAFQKFGQFFEAQPYHHEITSKFWALSTELLAEGKLKTHPAAIREGGFAAIPQGVKDIHEKRVRGQKLVYRVDGPQE